MDLRPDFGSDATDHRARIRASVGRALELNDQAVSDLAHPPRPADWSVSITHAPGLGGWVAAPAPAVIGFDIEVRDRVKDAVIRRVCTPEEINLSDDLPALWCAKEALFKALARGKTATLSQLKVTGWRRAGELVFFTGETGARGVIESRGKLAAAWALSSS